MFLRQCIFYIQGSNIIFKIMYSGETVKNKFPVFVSFPTRTNFLLIKQIIIPKLPGYLNNKQKYERSECGYTVVSTD